MKTPLFPKLFLSLLGGLFLFSCHPYFLSNQFETQTADWRQPANEIIDNINRRRQKNSPTG